MGNKVEMRTSTVLMRRWMCAPTEDGGRSMSKLPEERGMYEENELIIFDEGLFGFEECRKYLPLPIDQDNSDFILLLSVEDENLSFVIVNPFALMEEYRPSLSADDYKKVGTDNEDDLAYYAVCVIGDVPEKSTINLKCPIVVNVRTRRAVQVILQGSGYGFRHSFRELKKGTV